MYSCDANAEFSVFYHMILQKSF